MYFRTLLLSIFTTLFICSLLIVPGTLGILLALSQEPLDTLIIEHEYYKPQPSIVLDDTGHELFKFQRSNYEPLPVGQLSPHLVNAFLCAEDWDFFNHHGISWRGIIRSIFVNIYRQKKAQGASTITQQLVKLLLLDSQKSFLRKIKEQYYALLLEKTCTKEQILHTYLNKLYFGRGIYGVQTACSVFWGISSNELSIAQAALLAAIIKSPFHYCPLVNPLSAIKRRNAVLKQMLNHAVISPDEYATATASPLNLQYQEPKNWLGHLKEYIRVTTETLLPNRALYDAGFIIHTTINREQQKQAYDTFTKQCSTMRTKLHPEIDGALVALEGSTGKIKAIIGGYNFQTSQFNRALYAKRQMGSVFKTIVYAAAIDKGTHLTMSEIDEPLTIHQPGKPDVWSPRNDNRTFNGQMTLGYALAKSNNIIAIKTALNVGLDTVINYARKFQITGPLEPYPSLALGCVEVTPLEIAAIFNVFAQHGWYHEPYGIAMITDSEGTELYKKNPRAIPILTPSTADQIGHTLQYGIQRLKKRKAIRLATQACSKTGTTNDGRTCWFVGATPDTTVAVYIGRDNNGLMGNKVYPAKTAFPIWLEFIEKFPGKHEQFSLDVSLEKRMVNGYTGEPTNDTDPNSIVITYPRALTPQEHKQETSTHTSPGWLESWLTLWRAL